MPSGRRQLLARLHGDAHHRQSACARSPVALFTYAQGEELEGVGPVRFQPIAPYKTDPTKWLDLPWIDRYSGQQFLVGTTAAMASLGRARLKTYRDVLREFRRHPEARSFGPDGRPCDRQTVGLLGRRVVQETYVAHVGKEANKLEEVETGLEQDPEAIYTEYHRPDRDEWTTVILPRLLVMHNHIVGHSCASQLSSARCLEHSNRPYIGVRPTPKEHFAP